MDAESDELSVADGLFLSAQIGEQIGPYKLESLIGQGGMGSVYLAVHTLLGRRVAIKVLAEAYAQDREYVSRFFHEARVVNDINHPNIVNVSDFIRMKSPLRVAYIMEYLEGSTVSEALSERRLSARQAVNLCIQLLAALEAMHCVDVVHRDLKPGNIVIIGALDSDLSQMPSVKILDFGIAKVTHSPRMAHHTATGQILGTPAYMAPEQISAELPSPAIDIYALGEIFFELISGHRFFLGDTIEVFRQKLETVPPKISLPDDVAGADLIENLIRRCLFLEPELRPSVGDFRKILTEILALQPAHDAKQVLVKSPMARSPSFRYELEKPKTGANVKVLEKTLLESRVGRRKPKQAASSSLVSNADDLIGARTQNAMRSFRDRTGWWLILGLFTVVVLLLLFVIREEPPIGTALRAPTNSATKQPASLQTKGDSSNEAMNGDPSSTKTSPSGMKTDPPPEIGNTAKAPGLSAVSNKSDAAKPKAGNHASDTVPSDSNVDEQPSEPGLKRGPMRKREMPMW